MAYSKTSTNLNLTVKKYYAKDERKKKKRKKKAKVNYVKEY